MKKIDRLIITELIGPWIFGVAMFSALLIAATYLGRIAGYVVEGVAPAQIGKLTLLLLPAILVQTFAMSTLLSALLGFGRLSSDSEIVALRASGVSLYRIIAPVAFFSILVAGFAFFLNEAVVPSASLKSQSIVEEIARTTNLKEAQPTSRPIVQNGRLVAMIAAKDFSFLSRSLKGVTIITYDDKGKESLIVFAKELQYNNQNDWTIRGGADILSADGLTKFKTDKAWPDAVPHLTASPEELLANQLRDPNTYGMSQIRNIVIKATQEGSLPPEKIRNYEYAYYNKIALPLAAFIFGTLGATLGIRNHRTGTAAGFAMAIAIIFAYFMLGNFMNVWALGGVFPPYVASFTPLVIGLVASGVIMWRRNA